MTPAPYTEDTLVQQTTADYLEQQLGWEPIYAHNVEDFGPNSLLGRASDHELLGSRSRNQDGRRIPARVPRLSNNRRRITKTRREVASLTLQNSVQRNNITAQCLPTF